MQPLDTLGRFTPLSLSSLKESKNILPDNEIYEKIRSITAEQINFIGSKIADKIFSNLGPLGKEKVAQQVKQQNGIFESAIEIMDRLTLTITKDKKEEKQFFSPLYASSFILSSLEPTKDLMADSFSKPSDFLNFGMIIELSDACEPTEFLSNITKKIGISLTSDDVPYNYSVHLKLNKELTKEKSELVFSLIEKSDNDEFSKTTFTINEVTEEFYSNLYSFF